MSRRHFVVSAIVLVALTISTQASARRRSVSPAVIPFNELYTEGGYANLTSVERGGPIRFHVATRISPFTLTIVNLADHTTVLTRITNLVSRAQNCSGHYRSGCGWDVTTTFDVPVNWPSGYYAAQFPTSFGTRNIIFVVRAIYPGLTSKTLIVSPTHTYQAYNAFGGNSLYPSNSPGRARIVSFDRPYEQDSGLGLFDFWERKFIDWMESNDRKYEVATDTDLQDPNLLTFYNVVVLVGHSEYWTAAARRNLEAFSQRGRHIAIFGGNTMWWQVRLEDNNRTLVGYKDVTLDPQVASDGSLATIHWFEDPVNNPENLIVGASFRNGGYANKLNNDPNNYEILPVEQRIGFTVTDPSHWIFIGVNVTKGTTFGREAVGLEVDGVLYNCDVNGDIIRPDGSDGTPLNYHILAVTPASNGHGTLGMYVNSAGGAVFNAATMNWAAGLANDPIVRAVTQNVLDTFQNVPRLLYDPVVSTTLTEDRFNCSQAAAVVMPGWRGNNPGGSTISSRCAYEGAAGLELTGSDSIGFARQFTAKGEPRNHIELRFYLNIDAFQRRSQFPAPIVTLRNRKGAQTSQVALVEVDLNDGKRLVRIARRSVDGTFVRSEWIELSAGWHLIEATWRSPGALVIQADSAASQTLNNQDANQLVNELVIEYPPSLTGDSGMVCIDAIAAATEKLGRLPALLSIDR